MKNSHFFSKEEILKNSDFCPIVENAISMKTTLIIFLHFSRPGERTWKDVKGRDTFKGAQQPAIQISYFLFKAQKATTKLKTGNIYREPGRIGARYRTRFRVLLANDGQKPEILVWKFRRVEVWSGAQERWFPVRKMWLTVQSDLTTTVFNI